MEATRTARKRPEAFAQLVDNLCIKGTSSDGSVTVTLTIREGMSVELATDVKKRHDDTTLAKAITTTLRGVLSGYSTTIDRTFVPEPDSEPRLTPNRESWERRLRFATEASKVDVETASPRQLVKTRMDRDGVQVRIRPGTLSRIDIGLSQLTTDINKSVAEAHQQYRRKLRQIREEH